jgi:hypothetical protein
MSFVASVPATRKPPPTTLLPAVQVAVDVDVELPERLADVPTTRW